MGVIEAGMCNTVAIFRAMNGYSQVRIGGTGARSAVPISGDQIHMRAYGWQSAGQMFAPTFMRHLHDYGTTPAQVAAVKVAHSKHASNNPKAFYRKRYTVEEVLASRMICKPLHLLDCCVETDNATCIIVTRTEHVPRSAPPARPHPRGGRKVLQTARGQLLPARAARDRRGPLRQGHPVVERGARALRGRRHRLLRRVHLHHHAPARGLRASAPRAEGGEYVSDGTIELGGARPNNTSGGHLCEGYTHGMSMVIENVRQLRGERPTTPCPILPDRPDGARQHTHDYGEGGCRQVKGAEISANLGWGTPGLGSAMVLQRG